MSSYGVTAVVAAPEVVMEVSTSDSTVVKKKPKQHPPIVMCDLEFTASGRNWRRSKIFAGAFVIVHPAQPDGPIAADDRFTIYIQHPGIEDPKNDMWKEEPGNEFWNAPKQAAIRAFLLKKVKEEGVAPEQAFQAIYVWLKHQVDRYPNLVFMHDSGQDWEHINYALAIYCGLDRVQHITGKFRPCFDFDSYCMGLARKTWARSWWGNETEAAKVLQVTLPELPEVPHDHNPSNDAERAGRHMAFLLRRIFEVYSKNALEDRIGILGVCEGPCECCDTTGDLDD
jgi:hypothetical protein